MSFLDSLLQDPYKRGILLKGAIGMGCVIVLAFAVSFFDDSSDTKEETQTSDAAAASAPQHSSSPQNPRRIPASERFDYSHALELPEAPESTAVQSASSSTDTDAIAQAPAVSASESPEVPAVTAGESHEHYELIQPSTESLEEYGAEAEIQPLTPAVPAAAAPGAPAVVSRSTPAPATASNAAPYAAPKAAAAAKPAAPPASKPTAPKTATPKAAASVPAAKPASATLYCGSYTTRSAADEQKALLAFQGITSRIVKLGPNFALALGPYASKEQARSTLASLQARGLVRNCSVK